MNLVYLDQNFLFFIPSYHFAKCAITALNGEIRNILPMILEPNRYFSRSIFNGKHGGKEHVSFVKKKVLSR